MEYASIVLQNEYRQTAWTSPSYNGNMSFLPYPPPPEPGWYDDDVTVMAQPTAEPVDNAADSLETRERLAAQNESDDHDMQDVSVARATLPFRTRTISTGTAPCFPKPSP